MFICIYVYMFIYIYIYIYIYILDLVYRVRYPEAGPKYMKYSCFGNERQTTLNEHHEYSPRLRIKTITELKKQGQQSN